MNTVIGWICGAISVTMIRWIWEDVIRRPPQEGE